MSDQNFNNKMNHNKMNHNVLYPLFEKSESQYSIQAPTVGVFSIVPRSGDFVTCGSLLGRFKILNTQYELHLPEGLYGRVLVDEDRDYVLPVDYGQELLRLNTDESMVGAVGAEQDATNLDCDSGEAAIHEEGHVIVAFTTGIFYSKPSPDSPPFVKEGQEIEKGKALGLIEVMKTFNHIIFHGTEDSESGVVKKILVGDTEEVKSGQPLFVIE